MTKPYLVREQEDWWLCAPKYFVHHWPTHSTFEVFPDPGLGPEDVVDMDDFHARLIHVYAGHAPPPPQELAALCREAIAMCLYFLGMIEMRETLRRASNIRASTVTGGPT